MSWQARGEGEGGIQKGETKGSNCATVSFLPNPPPFPLIPTHSPLHTHTHPHALNTVDPSGTWGACQMNPVPRRFFYAQEVKVPNWYFRRPWF